MDKIDWLNILKWVLIVLFAGFIGQFGKSFAKHLIEKARLKREKEVQSETEETLPQERMKVADNVVDQGLALAPQDEKDRAKQEKKMAKALAKKVKKEAKNLEKGKQ